MTDTRLKVPGSRRSGQQFLFFRAQTRSGSGPVGPARPGPAVSALPADLALLHPGLLGAEALLAAAAEHTGSTPCFAVLAIRSDPPAPEVATRAINALAVALDQVCRPCRGIWGWMEPELFGCWLPDAGPGACQAAAEAVAAALAACQGVTATIGMAIFPTLDFARDQMWANACKALNHAAFFGADSRVFFDAVSLNISGDRLFENGDLEGAVAEFQKALELDPAEINVLNSLGVCWSHLGQPEKALACFEKARRLDPGEAMAWYNLGLVQVMTGQDKGLALADFQEADRLSPDVFEIKLQIGKLCLESGDLAKARDFLENAVALKPASSPAHRLLGQCLEQSGLAVEAVAVLRKAVKANPNDAEALSLLGTLMDRLGENAEIALAFCRHSVEVAPDVAEFHRRLACLYEKTGETEQAAMAFEKAKALEQAAVVAADTGDGGATPNPDERQPRRLEIFD